MRLFYRLLDRLTKYEVLVAMISSVQFLYTKDPVSAHCYLLPPLSQLKPSMMRLLLVLTTLSYLPALSLGKSVGSIQIEGYGDIFLLAPDWAAPSIEVGSIM